MQTIKNILSGNKNNSAESKVLDKIDLLSINYDDTVSIILNDKKIQLATILAKMLADNEAYITSSSWLDMLSNNCTNQNKLKASLSSVKPKSPAPLIATKDTMTMTAEDFKAHKIGLYSQFQLELDCLLARYSITCFDTLLTAADIFTLQDVEEYGQKLKDETVSNEILEKITLPYISVTRNNEHIIVVLDDCNRISEIKHFMIDLEDHFINISRADMVVTFKEFVV